MTALERRHQAARELRKLFPDMRPGRKTLAQVTAKRQRPGNLPDWRLLFMLPTELAFALSPGPYPGIVGVTVGSSNVVEITGKSKDWLFAQAAALLKALGRGRSGETIVATLRRTDRDAPMLNKPVRFHDPDAIAITFASGQPAVVVSGHAMRPVLFEG